MKRLAIRISIILSLLIALAGEDCSKRNDPQADQINFPQTGPITKSILKYIVWPIAELVRENCRKKELPKDEEIVKSLFQYLERDIKKVEIAGGCCNLAQITNWPGALCQTDKKVPFCKANGYIFNETHMRCGGPSIRISKANFASFRQASQSGGWYKTKIKDIDLLAKAKAVWDDPVCEESECHFHSIYDIYVKKSDRIFLAHIDA